MYTHTDRALSFCPAHCPARRACARRAHAPLIRESRVLCCSGASRPPPRTYAHTRKAGRCCVGTFVPSSSPYTHTPHTHTHARARIPRHTQTHTYTHTHTHWLGRCCVGAFVRYACGHAAPAPRRSAIAAAGNSLAGLHISKNIAALSGIFKQTKQRTTKQTSKQQGARREDFY